MRSFGVLMLLASAAAADPGAAGTPPVMREAPPGPSKVIEVEPWVPPARAPGRYPGVGGKDAAGVVIDPGAHPDGRPWPYGMWIRPGGTQDHNVLVPGTNGLPDSAPLATELGRSLDLGVGRFLEWLMTPRFVRRN